MKMKLLIQILAIVTCCSLSHAEDSDLPMAKLPPDSISSAGTLSLFADYKAVSSDGTIPVYVINQTDKLLKLAAQEGDIYLKLEAQNKNGEWIRAQSHVFSFCGNSYFYSPTIRPGHFIKVSGYQPKAGDKQKIRFSLYQQDIELSSNVGIGLASAKDIELSSNDDMTKRENAKKQNKSAHDNP